MRWFGWFRRRSASAASGGETTGLIAGRRRTRGVPYLLPYDVEELNRLDFQHYMLRAALRGNYAAPIRQPRSILDVGTGTGRWAFEMALAFPNATVVGVDLNPPSDEEASRTGGGRNDPRPPNCTFVSGNILEGLSFPDASFDYIHQRALIAAIPHDRWPAVARELARLTRPGGWVELREITGLEHSGPATTQLLQWLQVVLAQRGVQFADGGKVADVLREAGLTHVTARSLQLVCGYAGGRTGKMLEADWLSLFNAMHGFMVALGLTTAEQFEEVAAQARAEFASPRLHCYMPVYIAYGQRPG